MRSMVEGACGKRFASRGSTPHASSAARCRYPEVLLWQRLKGGQSGVKFRKQHPIGDYVADFYCAATRTVIEVDGEAHNRGDRPRRDIDRDRFLKENGYRVDPHHGG